MVLSNHRQIREDRDLFLSMSGPPAGCQALQAMQLVGAPVGEAILEQGRPDRILNVQ